MLQIGADDLARTEVDGQVMPFLGGDAGKLPFHHRLACGDKLADRGMTRGNVALDMFDQRHDLHAEIGSAHVRTPVPKAPLLCRILLEKNTIYIQNNMPPDQM